MFEGMKPVFEGVKQLCQTNILAIDKIAKENGIPQHLIARLFVVTMEHVINRKQEDEQWK